MHQTWQSHRAGTSQWERRAACNKAFKIAAAPHALTGYVKPDFPAAAATPSAASLARACRRSVQTNAAQQAPSLGAITASTLKEFGFAKDFDNRFQLGRTVGSGTFGTVHVAVNRSTGQEYAVKVITKRIMGGYMEQHFVRRVRHEVDIYNHLGRSLNVAYMYGAYENAVQVQLVMELCTGGELWTRVQRGKYDEGAAAALAREILRTVAQCHAKDIVLRDVKPENFLFLTPAADAPLKMIDFGLATYCRPGEVLKDRAGSPLYVAPEVLKQAYGQKCDVWSAGVIAYQLLTGRFPFEDEDRGLLLSSLDVLGKKHFSNKEVFFSILYNDLDFERPPWDAISPLAKDFVKSLLQRDVNARPTAAEALQHPWLAQADAAVALAVAALVGPEALQGQGQAAVSPRPLSDSLVQRLQRYGTYGRLKQLALRAVASYMATSEPERVASLAAAFRQLDPQGAGRVPYAAVVQLLNSGEWDLSTTEVAQLLATFDVDSGGNVDYDEWLAALIDWREVQESAEWQDYVNKVFDMFDSSHTGNLTPEALQRILCSGQLPPASSSSSDSDAADGEDDDAAGRELEECPFDDVVPAALREVHQAPNGFISREDFERLLRTAAVDRLEFYEDRRRRRRSEAGAGEGAAGDATGLQG